MGDEMTRLLERRCDELMTINAQLASDLAAKSGHARGVGGGTLSVIDADRRLRKVEAQLDALRGRRSVRLAVWLADRVPRRRRRRSAG